MLTAIALALLGQGLTTVYETVDGTQRSALIFPPSDPKKPAPLVLCFHGHGGTANFSAHKMDVQTAWPEAIVVYPQGLPTAGYYDPQGKQPGWNLDPTDTNRDLYFVDALISDLKQKYNVDSSHIFAMGFSNGALLIYTLWATRPDIFAGFGIFEGRKIDEDVLKVPKPAFVTIGDIDKVVLVSQQNDSLKAALDVNHDATKGTEAGPNETLYSGTQPVMLWSYHGGHEVQSDAVPPMVKFWKSLGR